MARLLAALAKRLATRTEGASLVEYALALLLIAVVTIVMISLLGTTLSSFFTSAAGTI
jgi:pilus assembly protein Flp/PilA